MAKFDFTSCSDTWLRESIEDCGRLLYRYLTKDLSEFCNICRGRKCYPSSGEYDRACVWFIATGRMCERSQVVIMRDPILRRNRIRQLRRWILAMQKELTQRGL